MSPDRRISIGFPGSEEDNEWHKKIRDILDISKANVSVKCDGKNGSIRRRTVCCESPIVARDSKALQHQYEKKSITKDRDDSTAALSFFSSCDVSPASPARPEFSSLCRLEKKEKLPSSSPNEDRTKQDEVIVLAKHRINSTRRGSTGSLCTSSPKPPFAETKSPPSSPFSKAQAVNKRWLNDDYLPDVPFSPCSDHGSFGVSSEHVDDLAAGTSEDGCQSPVSIYKDGFRRLNSDYADKTCHNEGRRSSCCDPPNKSSSHPVPRRSSCPDKPPRSHHSPHSDKMFNNDKVLRSPFHSTPKDATPKISIKVQRRSSSGEFSLPFAPELGSKSGRRGSLEIDPVTCRVRNTSQSLLHHQKRRTSDSNAHFVISQARAARRTSDIGTSEKGEVHRRRASDYDIPRTSGHLTHSETDANPPISLLIFQTNKSKSSKAGKMKQKRDAPVCSSRPSSFAYF
jgi:hypothetical protein